jgi:hypothetical protein
VVAYLPPVVAYDNGTRTYWLADGWLRHAAHKQAGRSHIEVEVRPGSLREARLYAASCNARHGQPRTLEDKRRAVLLVVEDEEARGWSNAAIAAHCGGMSPPFVAAIKKAWQDLQKMQREQAEAAGRELIKNSARKDKGEDDEEGDEPAELEVVGAPLPETVAAGGGGDFASEEAADREEDQAVTRERWLRCVRKLDRFSALLGDTTERLLAEYRAEQAERKKAEDARRELEAFCRAKPPQQPEKPKTPFDD